LDQLTDEVKFRRLFAGEKWIRNLGSVPDSRRFRRFGRVGPSDRRRGRIIRAVVGFGKPIELFRRLKEPSLTAEIKAPTLFGGGEASQN